MPQFDTSKAYAAQEDVFFDDGREIELLHFIYNHPDLEHLRNSPERVLGAIDEFARTKKYLMNVGEDKGRIVTELIREVRPQTMVELGGYIGYSTILFASTLRTTGGTHYFSLERNPEFAAITTSLIDLAGLTPIVKVIIGPSDVSLQRLHASGELSRIDLLFLDHYKPAYTPDLKLCEELALVGPGSVLVADNVVKPGNPPYLEYVRMSTAEKRAGMDARNGMAAFGDRTARQYEKREGDERLDVRRRGDPGLVYESRLVESFEPTGVPDAIEVTRCVGREEL